MSDHVLITDHDGVRCISINRPAAANALTRELAEELRAAVAAAEADGVRGLVLAGEGPIFSGGIDFEDALEHARAKTGDPFVNAMLSLEREVSHYPGGVVIAAQGAAVGIAAELVICADAVVASSNLKISFPEVPYDIATGLATMRLPRAVGEARARPLLLSGAWIEAPTAREIGIVTQVWDGDAAGLRDAAIALARQLSVGDPAEIRKIKLQMTAHVPSVDELKQTMVPQFHDVFSSSLQLRDLPTYRL